MRTHILSRVAVLITISLIGCCNQRIDFDPSITQDELISHVDFLASDSLQGRLPGTPFDRVAAKYIKDYMEFSGIELVGKNGYQFFDFVSNIKAGESNSLSINGSTFRYDSDFSVHPFSSTADFTSDAVFVGYGIDYQTDSITWSDYQSVNVNGKWVVVFRGEPDVKILRGKLKDYLSDRSKVLKAIEKGASGVVLISPQGLNPSDELIKPDSKQFDIGVPVIHIKRSIANQLLHPFGYTVRAIEQKISHEQKPISFDLKRTVGANTEIHRVVRTTQNVIGHIEGKDPKLKGQYVVIGAHYDHIGLGGEGSSSRMPGKRAVHNGADDNASGVAALLEIGQKLAFYKPKRSVLLIAFGAEEFGLLGSRHFIENPLVPLDSISAMINLDMLGRLVDSRMLKVGGVRSSLEAESLLTSIGLNWDFNLLLSPEGYGPSDHASFYSSGIPVLFFTTGPHSDYHTPDDVIDKINFEGLTQSSKFVHEIVHQLTALPYKLSFRESTPMFPTEMLAMGEMGILGILPDINYNTNSGVKVTKVYEGSPAFNAGIIEDDIIFAIDGEQIRTIQCFVRCTQKLAPGKTVSLEYKRASADSILLVQL